MTSHFEREIGSYILFQKQEKQEKIGLARFYKDINILEDINIYLPETFLNHV